MSNTPTLRFGEFDGEWSEKRLGDISSQISYGLTVRPEYHKEGIPLISARELRGGMIDYLQAPKISKTSYDKLSDKAKAKKGDIFLTKTGTIGLSAYVSLDIDFPVAITQNIAVIRIDNTEYSHQFIMQTFKTNEFYKSAISRVNQSTIMDLQLQDIRKLELCFPTKPEQQKIATFLSAVDSSIEQLSQKEQLLRDYKKGVMQKIFSRQIRFKRDDGGEFEDWAEKRLGELFNISSGKSKSKYLDISGKNIIVDMGGISSDGKLIANKFTNYSDDFLTTQDLVMPKDDIGGGFIIGRVATIPQNNKYICGDHIYKLSILEGDINYFKYAINSYHVNKSFRQKANGTAQVGLNKKEVENQIVFSLSLPEQTKIANFLSSLDKQIEQVSTQLAETKTFKRGLLQRMFV